VPTERKANRGPSAGPDNRRALIAAARDVFGEVGLSAPFNSVAKRAGVGQGSLYRHFPDRVSLGVAVFDENIGELERLAAHPGTTVEDLFDAVADQVVGSKALIDLITDHRHDPRAERLGARVTAVADILLARGQAAGTIGPQVDGADVMLAISMLAFVLARTEDRDRADVRTRARAMFRAAFGPDASPA
jgi:AcrR family transcriptional regulator